MALTEMKEENQCNGLARERAAKVLKIQGRNYNKEHSSAIKD